ncbi:malto-oligosyltrehalose synthase [Changpingibacter yushuensis]|uniref:malto-oligosyltrehalose synthase n=1 Tax=Changpingibacter yushuensis TaxID=2758440 RepID=UPI0015F4DE16|nr:malto-oligosyltrehalose synthase [Changpingibacter yushuensis]
MTSVTDTRRFPAIHSHVPAPERRQPISTYRLQLGPQFTFAQAIEVVPYLKRLGISDVYCSPILQAAPGSTHGYDVVDHTRISQEMGGRAGFQRLADTAHANGMGIVVDVVPNHMAVPTPLYLNKALWSVLRWGADSAYSSWFDIDLEDNHDGLLMPVLGERIGSVLAKGEITLEKMVVPGFEDDGEQHVLRYFEHVFPVRAQTESLPLTELLDRQFYRLAYWRVAEEELNYRRFFDVDTLAAIRVERPEVFDQSHALLLELFDRGYIDSFRIDHPDGLADPRQYLERLHAATGGAWIAVEKILEGDEELPSDWKCSGTTGYDASRRIDALLTDPSGVNQLLAQYVELSNTISPYETIERKSKAQIITTSLHSEMERLTMLIAQICHTDVRLRDHTTRSLREALGALLVEMDRYRAYVVPSEQPGSVAENAIRSAATRAAEYLPEDRRESLEVVVDIILGKEIGSAGLTYVDSRAEAIIRFQQVSGAVMAKGLEDTTFYRFTALTSATEVGGNPNRPTLTPDDVSTWAERVAQRWPVTMSTLTTHDTKRGEDTRAAIAVLSEWAVEWRALVSSLRAHTAAERPAELDGQIENLLWQTIIGTWTDEGPIESERLVTYLRKAAREQKTWTTWTSPDLTKEEALFTYTRHLLSDPVSVLAFSTAHSQMAACRRVTNLSQKALALTLVGVSDVYQGEEVIQNSLVDPDNRRPVDFAAISDSLKQLDFNGGLPSHPSLDQEKLWVTSRLLRLRSEHTTAFASQQSGYTPLPVTTGHAFAFARTIDGNPDVVVVCKRLHRTLSDSGGFGRHNVVLPSGRWKDVLTGAEFSGGVTDLAFLLGTLPVAALERV